MDEAVTTGKKKNAFTPEKKALTSMVLGIVGSAAWLIPVAGLPIQIVGLVFGLQTLSSPKKNFAVTGITLAIIGITFSIVNAWVGAVIGAFGPVGS